MIFNSFSFLFLFLPLVVSVFFWLPEGNRRVTWLLAASIFFYGISGIEHALSLAFGIVWVYFICRSNRIVNSKLALLFAVSLPLLLLFYYKYLGFFLESVFGISRAAQTESFSLFSNIILPAGISFFTFQLVSFAIDRYRDQVDELPSLQQFALYISFFPQLVAGPILRFSQIENPLRALGSFKLSEEDVVICIRYVCLGLALKVALADTLLNAMAPYTTSPENIDLLSAAFVIAGFSFQIYFDFYGYSLIAIGLGRLFGFRFPMNFDRPYSALDIKSFWRRWHVSLSFWIRDYLYLSLGGNKAYARNILIVFLACGLWHGAGWNFVVWGLYHGVLVGLHQSIEDKWRRLPEFLQTALTFAVVSLGWLLFLFDFGELSTFLNGAMTPSADDFPPPSIFSWLLIVVSFAVCFFVDIDKLASARSLSWFRGSLESAGYAALSVFILLLIDRSQDFIYFRF